VPVVNWNQDMKREAADEKMSIMKGGERQEVNQQFNFMGHEAQKQNEGGKGQ